MGSGHVYRALQKQSFPHCPSAGPTVLKPAMTDVCLAHSLSPLMMVCLIPPQEGYSSLTIITAWKLFLACSMNLFHRDVSLVELSAGKQCFSVPFCQNFSQVWLLPLVSSFVVVLVFLTYLQCSCYCRMGFHQNRSIPFWRTMLETCTDALVLLLRVADAEHYSTSLLTQQIHLCTMFVFPQQSSTTYRASQLPDRSRLCRVWNGTVALSSLLFPSEDRFGP